MKAMTVGLSGKITMLVAKITMLVAISHRPDKGHCSWKQYYLARTKIEYSHIQTILITISGTVHHNCFIKEGFDIHKSVNKKCEYEHNSIQGEFQGQINSTFTKNNVHMGDGEKRKDTSASVWKKLVSSGSFHCCPNKVSCDWSVALFRNYSFHWSTHGRIFPSPSLGLSDHASWLPYFSYTTHLFNNLAYFKHRRGDSMFFWNAGHL